MTVARYDDSPDPRESYCTRPDGLREGPATLGWYPNGRPVAVGWFLEGVADGPRVYYFNDGRVWRRDQWRDGGLIGEWNRPDLGRLSPAERRSLGAATCGGFRTIVCEENDPRVECNPSPPPPTQTYRLRDGSQAEGTVVDGARFGPWTFRSAEGALVRQAQYNVGEVVP
jgi:hypothetical protein